MNQHSPDVSFAVWSARQPVDEGQPEPGAMLKPLRSGDLCPHCGAGRLDYDGLLNLACPICGYSLSGGAGCT